MTPVVHIALAPAGATPFCMAYVWDHTPNVEETFLAPTCLTCIAWVNNGNPRLARRDVDFRRVVLLR